MTEYQKNVNRLYGDLIVHSDNDELYHSLDYNHPVAVIVPNDTNLTVLHSAKIVREIEKTLQHFKFPYFIARFSYCPERFLQVDRSKIIFATTSPERRDELFNLTEYIGMTYCKAILEISDSEMYIKGCSIHLNNTFDIGKKFFLGRYAPRKINTYLRQIGYDDPMFTVYQKFTAKHCFGLPKECLMRDYAVEFLQELTTKGKSYYEYIINRDKSE